MVVLIVLGSICKRGDHDGTILDRSAPSSYNSEVHSDGVSTPATLHASVKNIPRSVANVGALFTRIPSSLTKESDLKSIKLEEPNMMACPSTIMNFVC